MSRPRGCVPVDTVSQDGYVVRVRRQSPHPTSRRDSIAYAVQLKQVMEQELRDALAAARARNTAVGGVATLKTIADEYLAHMRNSRQTRGTRRVHRASPRGRRV